VVQEEAETNAAEEKEAWRYCWSWFLRVQSASRHGQRTEDAGWSGDAQGASTATSSVPAPQDVFQW